LAVSAEGRSEAVRKYRREHKDWAMTTVRVYQESVRQVPQSAWAVDANLEYFAQAFRKLAE
jgi:hypothetical protein